MTRRIVTIAAAVFCSVVLQGAALYQWGLTAFGPSLVMAAVVCIGLNDGWVSALTAALCAGLLLDGSLGNGTGSYTVPLAVMALVAGSRRFALGNEALPALVLPAGGYILARLYELAALYLTRGSVYMGASFWLRLGLGLVLTAAVSWPVFILLQRTLGRAVRVLRHRREDEGLSSAYFFLNRS